MGSSSSPASNWGAWIQQGVAQIREAKLERVLRPLIPTQSAVEVSLGPFGVVGGWFGNPGLPTSCRTTRNTTASLWKLFAGIHPRVRTSGLACWATIT